MTESIKNSHRERHHQGLDGQLIDNSTTVGHREGRVVCRERLGGMLKHYDREAA